MPEREQQRGWGYNDQEVFDSGKTDRWRSEIRYPVFEWVKRYQLGCAEIYHYQNLDRLTCCWCQHGCPDGGRGKFRFAMGSIFISCWTIFPAWDLSLLSSRHLFWIWSNLGLPKRLLFWLLMSSSTRLRITLFLHGWWARVWISLLWPYLSHWCFGPGC